MSPYFNPAGIALIALFIAVLTSAPASALPYLERVLWPSPDEAGDLLDQAQLDGSSSRLVRSDYSPGQIFVPSSNLIKRIDFLVRNESDERPGTVKIWQWDGESNYAAMQSSPPLFKDQFDLIGRAEGQRRSVFPALTVTPGQEYFLEFSLVGRENYRVGATPDSSAYPLGYLRGISGADSGDLWFRIYTHDPAGTSSGPTFAASDDSLPFITPLASPGPVTRQDYFDRFKAVADHQRHAAIHQNYGQPHRATMHEAFLYKATGLDSSCDESGTPDSMGCIANIVEMFRYATDLRDAACPPSDPDASDPSKIEYFTCDPKVGYNWLYTPAIAYSWVRDDMDPTDQTMVEALLIDTARRFWAGLIWQVGGPEAGVFNRSMIAAAGYWLVVDLVPGDPQEALWLAYAEGVWNEALAAMDGTEDSSHYDWHFMETFIDYAEFTGRSATLWNDPDMVALIERYYATTFPSGVTANTGDGSGWNTESVKMMSVFERAATELQDERFKQMAHRVYDNVLRTVCENPPAADLLSANMPSLARAYFAADESVSDQPIFPSGEIEDSTQVAGSADPVSVPPGGDLLQVITAGADPWSRVDLLLSNSAAATSGRFSVYLWQGSALSTLAGTALYVQDFSIAAGASGEMRSFHPYIRTSPGSAYAIRLEDTGGVGFNLLGAASGDVYPSGDLFASGVLQPSADLYFRTYTLASSGSTITYRRKARKLRYTERCGSTTNYYACPEPVRYYSFDPDSLTAPLVPDKLVLRSGPDPAGFHAAFNLLGGSYGHAVRAAGALSALMDQESVLLWESATPYFHQTPVLALQDHDESMPIVRHYSGGTMGTRGESMDPVEFSDYQGATVVSLQGTDQRGWQIEKERRIFFVKDRFMWVRDRFTFPAAMDASVGPLWHTADVHPVAGSNWFNVYNRILMNNVYVVRNPERYALMWFLPRTGFEVQEWREPAYERDPSCVPLPSVCGLIGTAPDCRSGPQYMIAQRNNGSYAAGQSVWFDTLLLPGAAPFDQADVDTSVQVIHDDGENTVLTVQYGDETWTLAHNPGGTSISTPSFETDADYVIARVGGGAEDYLLASRATHIRIGNLERSWPQSSNFEAMSDAFEDPAVNSVTSLPGWGLLSLSAVLACAGWAVSSRRQKA